MCNRLLPSIAGDSEELSLFTGGMVTVWDHIYVYYDNLLAWTAAGSCKGSSYLQRYSHAPYMAELDTGARGLTCSYLQRYSHAPYMAAPYMAELDTGACELS